MRRPAAIRLQFAGRSEADRRIRENALSLRTVLISFSALLLGLGAAVAFVIATQPTIVLPGGVAVDTSVVGHSVFGAQVDPLSDAGLAERIVLPEGFSIRTFAKDLDNPRLLHVTRAGDVLVSAPQPGKVYLLERDANRDGVTDGVRVLLDGLDRPHGIDWDDGWLYVGEGDAISRVRFDPDTRVVEGEPERIISDLPNGGNHWTKTVHIGPDGKLYVSVGSSCNVCEETDPRRAAILRYALDGSDETIVATGLRNAVDFAWHPIEGAMYATDNGRDLLGDDFPPCEINRVVEGGFYGWPYANGAGIPDPDVGERAPEKVAASIAPAHALPAHSAPLGIAFYASRDEREPERDAFPERYHGAAFVALHGSWNRSEKQGYEVIAVWLHEDGSSSTEPFVDGFERDDLVTGRPVGVAFGAEGDLYLSDDYAGSVYRITYTRPRAGDTPRSAPSDP